MSHQQASSSPLEVEWYVKPPTPFIRDHVQQLLPDWKTPPESVVIILLRSRYPLTAEGSAIELEKERLLQKFWHLSTNLSQRVYQETDLLMEIICPKTGTPLYSTQGELIFSLVTIIHQLLGFDFSPTLKGCQVLKHPLWQTAVYPGLLLSTASVDQIEPIISYSPID